MFNTYSNDDIYALLEQTRGELQIALYIILGIVALHAVSVFINSVSAFIQGFRGKPKN